MSKKQDRQGVRTAADIERKYPLGKSVTAEFVQSTVRNAVSLATNEFKGYVDGLDKDIADQTKDIESLKQADADIQTEIDSLQQTDTDTQGEISGIKESISQINKSIKTIEGDIDQFETVADGLGESVAQLGSFDEQVSETLAGLREDLNSAASTANRAAADVGGVISDVNDHFAFVEGGTTFKGSIVPLLLPEGTDLDGVILPNKYTGGNVAEYQYLHCPISSGTFSLEVEACGDQGQLLQRLTYSHKTNGKTLERVFYTDGWGEWVKVTDFVPEETGKLLWNEGVYYMTATQTVNLPEAVSAQRNGIILVFSEYSGGALDTAFHCFFVPKTQVATHPGDEYTFTLATSNFAYMGTKRVYIHDSKIVGHADNNQTGTGGSGVKFTNNRFALRYVFGI